MKSILINLLAAALVVASVNAEEKKPMSSANEVAVIKTSEGEMVAEFWPDVAPNTVENFKKLARSEFNDGSHERGVLSMARSSDPDSAGSQFFICLANVSRLDHQYTTFGKIIKG